MKRLVIAFAFLFFVFAAFQYGYSGSLNKQTAKRKGFELIAHRGLGQIFPKENIDNYTCTASIILPPRHPYLENTLESMEAAFDAGATIVEIDIRPTKDNRLVVFHDDQLDCRTDGHGKVWDHTVEALKKLDVGYGYTADGGKSYPFRGRGVGKMVTLDEVLARFPTRKFLIDNKSGNNLEVAQRLVESLSKRPVAQQQNLFLWSHDGAFEYVHDRLPTISRLLLPRHHQKAFFKSYLLSFGMAGFDTRFRDQGLGLPIDYVKLLWGWPNRFLNKVYEGGGRFYLLINEVEDLKPVIDLPLDGIVTDNVDLLSEALRATQVRHFAPGANGVSPNSN